MSSTPSDISVLHVDDEPDFAEMAATFLKREDSRFVIETATGVTEALDYLSENDVDCIVSDYDMPNQNGVDLLNHVRERYDDLPFILYTGKGSEEIASKAISAGVTDYLQKDTGTGHFAVLANRITNAVRQYRAQRELKASQKRLSLFIEQSPMGVMEYDSEYTIVGLNDAAERILGYSEDELRGESWEKIVADSSYENVDDVTSALLETKGGYHSIDENVRKDGKKIVCEWHNRVVTDDDGSVVAIFSLFQDITNRKQREERLEKNKARLEALFENSPDMINIHTIDGTIIDVNQKFTDVFDQPRDELTGRKVWEIDQEMDARSLRENLHDLNVGDQIEVETEYGREDGKTFPAEVRVARLPIEDGDQFMVISRDISERKEREQQLEAFASIVSHDLRNPLTVAHGEVELAREECDSEHLDRAITAHTRMDRLIEDLLELARQGSHVAHREQVEFASLVERSWTNVATADATLRITSDQRILADASRLQQLFENLIRNAVEHGGRDVTVRAGASSDGFYFEDDGPGIPEDERDMVFAPGHTTSEDGTGFGLSIVKRIAEAHDWEVQVTDGADGGARFEFTIVEEAAV